MSFAFARHPVPAPYRRSRAASLDPLLRRALGWACAPAVLLLALVFILPAGTPEPRRVEELPERLARLILEEPAPPPAPAKPRAASRVEPPEVESSPTESEAPAETTPAPPRHRSRRAEKPRVAPDAGQAGRERARTEVAQQLEEVGEEVGASLESLSASLAAAGDGSGDAAPSRRRARGMRHGRSRVDRLSSREVSSPAAETTSSLAVSSVDLGSVESGGSEWAQPSRAVAAAAPAPGAAAERSQASLLATVRRYAPGIRYCYDDALKTDPSLRGKMVFSLTIAPDGRVEAVEVTHDDLRHAEVRACALAQIRSWRFSTAGGATVFETPFVFRPPQP